MPRELIAIFVLTSITYVLWILRNTSFGVLWKIWVMFFVVLFATLGANFIKDEVKEWWNK